MGGIALVSSLYLPSAEWFLAVKHYERFHIDTSEIWKKQTLRNRTYILTANGIQGLSIPVIHNGGRAMMMKDIRISYSEPWVRVHKGALVSAYNSSPFFEYFRDELFEILERKPAFLVDLNNDTLELLIRKSKLNIQHCPDSLNMNHVDLKQLSDLEQQKSGIPPVSAYPQVFSYKTSFQPYLSAIDILSNTGVITHR